MRLDAFACTPPMPHPVPLAFAPEKAPALELTQPVAQLS